MRIGIDARPLASSLTGIGKYLAHLYAAMAPAYPGDEFIFFSHRPFTDPVLSKCRNVRQVTIPWPGNIWLSGVWEHILLPWRLRRDGIEVFHSARTCVPWRFGDRTVVTIHDLAFLHFPEIQPWKYRRYWKSQLRRAVEYAAGLVAVSEATREDLVRFFKIPAGDVDVVYEAADEKAFLPGGGDDQAVLIRLGIHQPFILFVGTLEPRKGIRNLLDAYVQIPKNIYQGVDLLLVGQRGWLLGETGALIEDLGPHVRALGYVSDADLRALYRHCEFYVLPSRYEGFGLTVLEAMAAGAPVITTTAGSLPEVAGDAAMLVEPENTAELNSAMMKMLMDSEIRDGYRELGRRRAAEFSWDRTAQETYAVLEKVGKA